MVATWAVGRHCKLEDLGARLSKAHVDLVVLAMAHEALDATARLHHLVSPPLLRGS